ncbi:MAG: hypothetical protein L3J67_06785 [Hyphomicrobiaceae bacterium]|nr:hypothetical protein [Hyphomicrobiaceae bacterium]
MKSLNRQSAGRSSWHLFASMGLALLFAFLLNVAGTSATLAHSNALHHSQMGHGVPALSHHAVPRDQTSKGQLQTLSSETNQQIDCLGIPIEHDCACCPSERSLSSSAFVRPNDDPVWLAQTRPVKKLIQPFAIRFRLNLIAVLGSSQPPSLQLSSLAPAQMQFVQTIRLLL